VSDQLMKQFGKSGFACALFLMFFGGATLSAPATGDALAWPALTSQTRPWTYWWWMGSAVDKTNLTRELQRYHDAGLGGVHIIPIYGAKGWESNYISYLSPKWMEMLGYTVSEAHRLGLDVDMTTGTGWCFGGPDVSDHDANASVVVQTFDLAAGEKLKEKFKRDAIQALVAFSPDGKSVELTDKISADGEVDWAAPGGTWRVYAISQKPSGQKVKRAAPGGEGWMLNPFYPPAMSDYLRRFTDVFAKYDGPKPRAMYQDSYEYKSDWSPDFFAQFEKRRGYKLQTELPAFFGTNRDDRAARVKSDYHETISDIMTEESEPLWVAWSHERGFITRYQAHGSPGNLLDLYAAADIPETEMFHTNQNPLVSKFASSAAHVKGGNLVAAETGTWLAEHFTETLGEMKSLVDEMFLSGVNHVFYHGTCYSPDEAGWPGWLFYASTEMNPRNSIWHDAPALNDYVARCQSILQSGKPDNDILLYWPIYDYWNDPTNQLPQLKIELQQIWFENQAVGKTALELWNRGYAFDYVSDRQLASAKTVNGKVQVPGGDYRVIVVPPCKYMPLETFKRLLALAGSGATVIFGSQLPVDVPGWGNLESRRTALKKMVADARLGVAGSTGVANGYQVRTGRVLIGDLAAALQGDKIPVEPMFDREPGLMCVRRAFVGGHYYFIANRAEQLVVDGWIRLGRPSASAAIMDPQTGRSGVAALRPGGEGLPEVFLQLAPGESIIIRCFTDRKADGPLWPYWSAAKKRFPLAGKWQVKFLEGGPEMPAPFVTDKLDSWTTLDDTNAQRFAGSAVYSITFDAPGSVSRLQAARVNAELQTYYLDLGRVCQSARVKLNGKDYGALITPPFRLVVDNLKPKGNTLEIEVTSVLANRIRDLDRRGVPWKKFHDINFVNLNYRPFDAADWPLTESGLLGPVTLTAVVLEPLASAAN
jgi:hypothetical protein